MKITKKQLEDAESILATQGADGNWDHDPYMHGMYNGMIIMKATLLGGDCEYREAPLVWGKDKVIGEVISSESKG